MENFNISVHFVQKKLQIIHKNWSATLSCISLADSIQSHCHIPTALSLITAPSLRPIPLLWIHISVSILSSRGECAVCLATAFDAQLWASYFFSPLCIHVSSNLCFCNVSVQDNTRRPTLSCKVLTYIRPPNKLVVVGGQAACVHAIHAGHRWQTMFGGLRRTLSRGFTAVYTISCQFLASVSKVLQG